MIIQIDIEQNLLEKFQNTANNWNISLSELLIKSTNEKIDSNKLIYEKLIKDIPEATKEETDEIMEMLNSMTEDDKKIVRTEVVSLWD